MLNNENKLVGFGDPALPLARYAGNRDYGGYQRMVEARVDKYNVYEMYCRIALNEYNNIM